MADSQRTTRPITSRLLEFAAPGALTPRIGARRSLEIGAEALRVLDRRRVTGNIVGEVRRDS